MTTLHGECKCSKTELETMTSNVLGLKYSDKLCASPTTSTFLLSIMSKTVTS